MGDSPNAVTYRDEWLAYPYDIRVNDTSQYMECEATPAISEGSTQGPGPEGATHAQTQPKQRGKGIRGHTNQHLPTPWAPEQHGMGRRRAARGS